MNMSNLKSVKFMPKLLSLTPALTLLLCLGTATQTAYLTAADGGAGAKTTDGIIGSTGEIAASSIASGASTALALLESTATATAAQ
ncbi:MAG TPA: hypothetical protein VJJ83_02275, partial [Candidatus Babeliales bacterium]|nr:hypothetical protein [Candidatus Babeliales bacterium]